MRVKNDTGRREEEFKDIEEMVDSCSIKYE